MLTLHEAKRAALQQQGNLHPRSQDVRDPLFLANEFFDPGDLIQVKYEMVRRVRVEAMSVTTAAARFGLSRPAFYQAQHAYRMQGLPGLIRRRCGPRRRHKLHDKVQAFLRQQRQLWPTVSASTLVAQVQSAFGIRVHPRTIERTLAGEGKKTPKKRFAAMSRGRTATRICAARLCSRVPSSQAAASKLC